MKRIKEYETKIKSLELEKGNSTDSNLFDKQNIILMNLANKLNERDEVNMHLNEELCAYDRITKESEEHLQRKTHRIEQLEKLLRKHKIPIPDEDHPE
jgi:chromosome segregation ATPase